MDRTDQDWDCIVVGGGAAGLSAALVLGRARRRTLVVDAGAPSNLPAHGIGGLLGHDGRPPSELYEMGRAELAAYGVEVRDGSVVSGRSEASGTTLTLEDGTVERARRVVLATGMDYILPEIPGMAELWGRSAFHCPFCHGWEVRDRPLAVLDAGPETSVHRALLLRQWSDDVVLLTDGPSALEPDARAQVERAGVSIREERVAELVAADGELRAIRFAGETPDLPRAGVLVATTLRQRSALAQQLGALAAPANPLMADALAVDGMHRTSAPGVFAVGDLAGQMPQVASAIAAGSMAAAAVVQSLMAEDHGLTPPGGG